MDSDHGSGQGALTLRPVRIALAIFVAVALLLVGLLWLERTGPSPVRNLTNVSTARVVSPLDGQPTTNNGHDPSVRIVGASISGGQVISELSTDDSCNDFSAGTTPALSTVSYTTTGTTIFDIEPGAFWYWVSIPVTSAGPQSSTITQATNYAPTKGSGFFTNGGGTSAFDSSCNVLATSVSGGTAANPNVTVSFTAAAAGTYIIRVHLQGGKTIVGSSPASTTSGFFYTYTFATTSLGNASTETLQLRHV